ncbi:UDP-glucose dehydrogenase family protein [Pseudalkalibacillus berkeleyi]|uniref:UDP-glucose 6-dehydrogenase n=1 Tax=Pseudalkalibacillus berkeleyi TaxID=1069813 RepID=A0ABS9H1M8_9BACL|nr:UDP-glucose/GDP-mannose dehydrogenase family protein [Pseudalkalibacillus berkeleyi]MCF6138834.1 UDP-glucose/GDP-mannose dehydrogenase family protein [Pseudalkalibacillus berkeleyi]
MKIAVVGTGYVGLVTGVSLAEIGHQVTCIDIDHEKVKKMKAGISPIYEPGLEEMMQRNIEAGRLTFTSNYSRGVKSAEVVYIAVGTPQNEDGSANLTYLEEAVKSVATQITQSIFLVIKSTVPVGTNNYMKQYVKKHLKEDVKVEVVSNPEFLREGSAVRDTFEGDRIVIGTDSKKAAELMEEVNRPFNIPIYKTDMRSAEMIKYASNAFLATKISFINEISNICEKTGANVEDVAKGMGMDQRIGNQFLQAGIGYGGSCFPKDTKALVQLAGNVEHNFELLKSVIKVNNYQQKLLVEKAMKRLGSLKGKKIAVLGLSFKPNTDDVRESASIHVVNELISQDASVVAYDPIANENAKELLPPSTIFAESISDAIINADCALILTDWKEIIKFPLQHYQEEMSYPLIFDGRNCYALESAKVAELEYHSIGRPIINETRTSSM